MKGGLPASGGRKTPLTPKRFPALITKVATSPEAYIIRVEFCPKVTGRRLCTKATEAEPRVKVTSKAY